MNVLLASQNLQMTNKNTTLFAKVERTYDLITMGEVLIRMTAPISERISDCGSFQRYVGGSELNVAVGATRLGLKTSVLTRLPHNDIGKYALHAIQSIGVCDKLISYDDSKTARLGVYYFEGGIAPRKPKVVYDRANSSFYGLSLDSLPTNTYTSTRMFHTSGITLALSDVRDTAIQAMKLFKEGGALISIDVNFRSALWDEATAREVITSVLPMVDVLFVSEETSRRMFGKMGSLEDIMRSYHTEYGIQLVATSVRNVISASEHDWSSSIYIAQTDNFVVEQPYKSIEIVNRIGSGDAFVAGALFGLLAKGTPQDIASYGNALAVLKCTIKGDLPTIDKDEVEALLTQRASGDKSEMSR